MHSGLMKLLKALEEDVEVEKSLEVDELAEEGHLGVIIVMRRDISLEIFLFQDDLGVPTLETKPMRLRISLNLS